MSLVANNIMDQWLKEGLSRILDFEVPDDLIQYILSIENEGDLNEYMKTLLDFDNPQHKTFFLEMSKRKFPNRGSALPRQPKKKIAKSKPQQDFTVSEPVPGSQQPVNDETKSKKKTKFVNLYSQEGKSAQVVMLKGRHRCDCQASKHELVNNCLQCGRIICTQEGSGPCLFCGNLVCTPQEQKELNAKTKASAKLMTSLMERSRPEGWEDAVLHRNKLLEYDKTSERRTHVTDDDSDYFQANSVWLNAAEREKLEKYQQQLHEKKHASRLNKKMTFDFGGRQIIEDKTIDYEADEDKIREMSNSSARDRRLLQSDLLVGVPSERDVAPGVNAPLLQFDPSVEGAGYAAAARAPAGFSHTSRVQDLEIQEMSDTGRCLSMHQPWASLLVEGIKLHEGRTWYTSHRGRLWIASTAKPPDQDVVRALENQYRVLYPDSPFLMANLSMVNHNILHDATKCADAIFKVPYSKGKKEKQLKFPSFYPTGCLLGCVNVDDCLPQEEYEKKYPNGESDSPYVFICSNPISLRLRFPIKGQHKIYALDKTIHHAALKSIQKMAKLQAEEAHAG